MWPDCRSRTHTAHEIVTVHVSPADPLAYLIASFCLILAAVIAIYLSARRATKIDPAVTLRTE
jgi:ABC-type lipoprotein release transport system permease subunit